MPAIAMHRFWNISDVVTLIIEHIADQEPNEVEQTLAALARVCRSISPVALDALWRRWTDFRRVDCLLQSIKAEGHYEVDEHARWGVYDHYAARVRTADLHDRPSKDVITAMKYRTPLFPFLKSIAWYFEPETAPHLPVLAAPTLRLVRIVADSGTDVTRLDPLLTNILATMNERSRDVQELNMILFPIDSLDQILSQRVLSLVTAFRALRKICIDLPLIACPNMVEGLSALPYLESLYFSEGRKDIPRVPFDYSVARGGFDALKSLTIAVPNGNTEKILFALPRCPVTYARLPSGPHGCVHHLTRLFGPTLTELELACDLSSAPLSAAASLLSSGIVAHLPLRGLTRVILGVPQYYLITDALCAEMAAAWPRLTSLKIRQVAPEAHGEPHSDMETRGMATLRGLLPFARLCPALDELALNVDASGGHWRGVPVPPPASRLRTLDLTLSVVTDPAAVADFVLRVFPELENMGCVYRRTPVHAVPDVREMPWNVMRSTMQRIVVESQRARGRECEETCFFELRRWL